LKHFSGGFFCISIFLLFLSLTHVLKIRMTAKKTVSLSPAAFIQQAVHLIEAARLQAVRHTNSIIVYTYFRLGALIVENEQAGKTRAGYGSKTILLLSRKLTRKYGNGYSVDNLENMRRFFLAYREKAGLLISEPVARKLTEKSNKGLRAVKSEPVARKSVAAVFPLSWTHYVILSRIENGDERSFYEIEAIQGNWGKRELQRQIDSGLFERLALSKNRKKVKQLAAKGQIIERPEDVFKSPYVLEFLGLDEKTSYTETDLETAIINKIEQFLLEMGKGFLFQGRQVRFTFDEEHFFVDLVLYNRLLQSFVLVDLKIGRLTHQDIGQMQMYVNYYDRYVKQEFENPSIGIIICKHKSDAVVEITLPEDNRQIFASQYRLYLPSKAALKKLVQGER
jgi:predicted nuclease of restriction endonuclease-like (RecB) superfamily